MKQLNLHKTMKICNFFVLQDLSTYRKALMGIAILWVVLYHFGFHTPIISHITRFGYAGVDIFMFLSGFGLFYSMNHDSNLRHYYKKRFIRIFPTYFIIGAFLSLFCFHDTFSRYLWRCSTLGFWTNGVYYEWFIPSILLLYALFPLAFKLISYKKWIYWLTIILFILIAGYSVFDPSFIDNWHFLLLYRIPIFLYGCMIAYQIKHNVPSKEYNILTIIGLFIFIVFFLNPELRTRYFAFTFLTPLLLIIMCFVLKNITIINKLGGVIGAASLEIYLIHLIFLFYPPLKALNIREEYFDLSTSVLALVSVVLGVITHKLLSKCIHV